LADLRKRAKRENTTVAELLRRGALHAIVDGQLKRAQKFEKLAEVDDRYRSKADVARYGRPVKTVERRQGGRQKYSVSLRIRGRILSAIRQGEF
jgi:hypothetical protein